TDRDFEVTIKMENFGDRSAGVRINVKLSDELKNIFGRYPPPKLDHLSLLEYMSLVQSEIDNRLERLARSSVSNNEELPQSETSLTAILIAE
uniref:Uncharacterized protein n=1 Tax=Plectus sambesii TaxID=2011161 RepID=A0A914WVH3_9BILA